MKTLIHLIIFGIGSHSIAFGQNGNSQKPLTAPKGYYKSLQSFSTEPKTDHEEIDKLKFPFDQDAADRRLSLTPHYLKNVTLNDFTIPAPPANSSDQTQAEINYLLSLQTTRTKLDVESSLYLAGVYYNLRTKPEDSTYTTYRSNLFHVGRTIGTWFNPTTLPLTADLISNVWRDASYFIWGFKYKFLRVRPTVIDPSIDNLEETDWAAYPSGHAANSYINAYIYQELAPEFADVFLKDAYDMAHSREIIGVHYPSDSEASRILARQFVNKLFQNEAFLKDFARVKQEWLQRAKESFERPSNLNSSKTKKMPGCGDTHTAAESTKCKN